MKEQQPHLLAQILGEVMVGIIMLAVFSGLAGVAVIAVKFLFTQIRG
jgi:hypothetical protein